MSALSNRSGRRHRGWPRRYPLLQPPNPPLAVALAAWLVAALTSGDLHDYARAAFYVGLAAWAWLEAEDGVNWFRRVVGVVGLVYVVFKIAQALGA